LPDDRVKRPAYQWYPADANGDEVFRLMTYEQQGIYRALLDHQWVEGSIPADPVRLAGLLPKITPERFADVWPLISAKFRPQADARLVNDRLELQRRQLDKYIKTQTANAAKRRPSRTSAASRGSAVAQPSMQSSTSSSSSTAVPVSKEQKQAPDKAPSPAKEFLTWFQTEYKTRRHGAVYFVSWDKHMPIIGRLLKLHAPDRLRKHAQILLTTDEDWTETTDRGIEILAAKINWLEERLCLWEVKTGRKQAANG
jgi:uncharacterized protein YdaU (DUF1376 family)